MNLVTPLRRLLHLVPAQQVPATLPVRQRPVRGSGPVVFAWFAAVVLTLHVVALLSMDMIWPQLRDPEYGRRLVKLKDRLEEHPNRPLVLMIGSSRASMGVRPDVWEESRPRGERADPMLFNLSLVGSGPVMELLCLRRVYDDGIRPDAVVFEFWPPFLREDGPYNELDRIVPQRLYLRDRGFVRDYYPDPAAVEEQMRVARWNPIHGNRSRWLAQVFPLWLPWAQRLDVAWDGIDEWGWLPGMDDQEAHNPRMRPLRLAHCENIYRQQFMGYSIHPLADRALREAVALAKQHDTQVAFAYLPEAAQFRGWYPPEVERAGRDYLATLCAQLDVPLIDAQTWMPDESLVDGFHLTRGGAAEFTRRFGPAVAAAFPGLTRRP